MDGEAGIGVIKAEVVRGDDDGDAATQGLGCDGEAAVADVDGAAKRGEVGIAEGIAQEIDDERLRGGGGIEVGTGDLGGEVLPEGGGDAEGAAVFVVELEALGDGVVGFLLRACPANNDITIKDPIVLACGWRSRSWRDRRRLRGGWVFAHGRVSGGGIS